MVGVRIHFGIPVILRHPSIGYLLILPVFHPLYSSTALQMRSQQYQSQVSTLRCLSCQSPLRYRVSFSLSHWGSWPCAVSLTPLLARNAEFSNIGSLSGWHTTWKATCSPSSSMPKSPIGLIVFSLLRGASTLIFTLLSSLHRSSSELMVGVR
jgi:hypothetical protein